MDVEILRYPGDIYDVIKWAVNRYDRKEPPEFREWLRSLMSEDVRDTIGHHLNLHTPQTPTEDGWIRGYPHSHVWSVNWDPRTTTVLTFLAMSDEGGEFGLGGNTREEPYEFFKPEIGTTIVFDAMRWHGVRAVTRGTRISLLSSGFPTRD